MKEIKFRGWDMVNKKWIDDYLISPSGDVMCSTGNLIYNGVHETTIKLIEFTGFKDKNANEIYEGDILQRSNDRKSNFIAVIEFKNGMFGGTTKPYDNHFIEMRRLPICDYNGTGYDEVIGNIYENLELITK